MRTSVLLELIIDPTCSIVLERQPAERDIMDRRPRNPREKLLTAKTMLRSVIQALVIFAASFGTYFATLGGQTGNAPLARTMGIVIIMLSNPFLVQVNSSDQDLAFVSLKRLIRDKVMWAVHLGTIAGLLLILYTPLCNFLKPAPLSALKVLEAVGISAVAVLWYDVVKLVKRVPGKAKN